MEWLKKLVNNQRVHRTENTRSLDDKFDANAEYRVCATLGKAQKEGLGAWYLEMAQKAGHFVAIPRYSPWNRHHPSGNSFVFNRSNEAYIAEMVAEGFLVAETVPGGIEVISPSEKMAMRMYGHDREGNKPRVKQFTVEELERTPARLLRKS